MDSPRIPRFSVIIEGVLCAVVPPVVVFRFAIERRIRDGPVLASPEAVRDYLRLLLHDRPHEVFVCVFLDSQHRVKI